MPRDTLQLGRRSPPQRSLLKGLVTQYNRTLLGYLPLHTYADQRVVFVAYRWSERMGGCAVRSSSFLGVIACLRLNTISPRPTPSVAPQATNGLPKLGLDGFVRWKSPAIVPSVRIPASTAVPPRTWRWITPFPTRMVEPAHEVNVVTACEKCNSSKGAQRS
ncbi:hypothetical protein [Phormidesmis sp. 146-33]